MTTLVVFRILHLLFGAFWVGAATFMTAFLDPALRQLDPAQGERVWGALRLCSFHRAMQAANVITLVSGVLLIGRLAEFGNPVQLLNSHWGIAIFVGALLGGASFIIGTFLIESRLRLLADGQSAPKEMIALAGEVRLLSRLNVLLLWLVIVCMGSAHYL